MPGRAIRQDPLMVYNFIVEIDGFKRTGWTGVSGLKGTNAKVEYREGGANHSPQLSAGLSTFPSVTLTRGQIVDPEGEGNEDLYNWWTQHYSIRTQGSRDFDYRRTVRIIQRNDAGEEVRVWTLTNAWVEEFTPISDFDAKTSEHSYESIVLAHEGFELEGGVQPPLAGGTIGPSIGL